VSATLGYDLPATASFPHLGPGTSGSRTLSGSDLLALVHEEDRDALASAFLRVAQGVDDSMRATCRIRHREGHWVVLEARGRPIVEIGGQRVGAVIVLRDVTEDLRTREELRRSKEVAEQANRAKNDFLSRMSHELRTPLNAVLGFAQLLDGSDLSSDQQRAVDHILRAGSHLVNLIDDVLDVSRIEAGRLRVSTEPVDAERAVADACALVQPLAAEHTVEVIQLGGEPNLRVAADSRRLVQVLLNLLTNGIKYNRPGGRVEVGWRRQGERVHFEVRDDGIGIRDEDLPLVFAPFERVRRDSVQPDGVGVGLALCKLLVEAMGGSIDLESQAGRGSTFWFDLPVADAA
jgi:signal transduction histidine kinase